MGHGWTQTDTKRTRLNRENLDRESLDRGESTSRESGIGGNLAISSATVARMRGCGPAIKRLETISCCRVERVQSQRKSGSGIGTSKLPQVAGASAWARTASAR